MKKDDLVEAIQRGKEVRSRTNKIMKRLKRRFWTIFFLIIFIIIVREVRLCSERNGPFPAEVTESTTEAIDVNG